MRNYRIAIWWIDLDYYANAKGKEKKVQYEGKAMSQNTVFSAPKLKRRKDSPGTNHSRDKGHNNTNTRSRERRSRGRPAAPTTRRSRAGACSASSSRAAHRRIITTSSVRRLRTVIRRTNTLQLRSLRRDNRRRAGTLHVEHAREFCSHRCDIVGGDAERLGGKTDLLDEVAYFVRVEGHVFMHGVLGAVAGVGGEGSVAVGGAAEESAKVGVEVGEELAVGGKREERNGVRLVCGGWRGREGTYYWFELVPFAGLLAIKGAAPPSSRKLTDEAVPFTLVESNAPLYAKNGSDHAH